VSPIRPPRSRIVLVTPALADANNGNWQTARRWARMLGGHFVVELVAKWPADGATPRALDAPALMIALHARRSAASIAAWRALHPARPLVVVLTGTDLYRDIASDAAAQRSLQLADRLVVLNQRGAAALPAALRAKVRVVLQSVPARAPRPKARGHLRALMVGHLREEKDPRTYFEAARQLAHRADIRLDHVGGALDPALAAEAASLMHEQPRYRWLGALPHAATRARIAAAHVLVHASRMEGGAHVVIEALASGTPVLASRIDGNLGLLGDDYAGVFAPGDAAGLAAWLERVRDDPAMLAALAAQGAARASLFEPARERAALLALVNELLNDRPNDLPETAA
jgi:putative glycosyltransferase (TIGR04348 family)